MKVQNRKIVTSILFLLISFVCMAQNAPPPPQPPPPPGLPIDGGVLFTLIAGLLYGAIRFLKSK